MINYGNSSYQPHFNNMKGAQVPGIAKKYLRSSQKFYREIKSIKKKIIQETDKVISTIQRLSKSCLQEILRISKFFDSTDQIRNLTLDSEKINSLICLANGVFSLGTRLSKAAGKRSLIVDQLEFDDNSICAVSPSKFLELGLRQGSFVSLESAKGMENICIILTMENIDNGKILLNSNSMKILNVQKNDILFIQESLDLIYLTEVYLSCKITEKEFIKDQILAPYFGENYRPVMTKDSFSVYKFDQSFEFTVEKTVPFKYGIVSPGTKLYIA